MSPLGSNSGFEIGVPSTTHRNSSGGKYNGVPNIGNKGQSKAEIDEGGGGGGGGGGGVVEVGKEHVLWHVTALFSPPPSLPPELPDEGGRGATPANPKSTSFTSDNTRS